VRNAPELECGLSPSVHYEDYDSDHQPQIPRRGDSARSRAQSARSLGTDVSSAPARREDDIPHPEVYDRWIVNGAVLAKPLPVIHRHRVVQLDVNYTQLAPQQPQGPKSPLSPQGYSTPLPIEPRSPTENDAAARATGPDEASLHHHDGDPSVLSETAPTDTVPFLPRMGFCGFKMAKVSRRNGLPVPTTGTRGRGDEDIFMLKPEESTVAGGRPLEVADDNTGLGVGYLPPSRAETPVSQQSPSRAKRRVCSRASSRGSIKSDVTRSTTTGGVSHKPMSIDKGAWVGNTLENVLAQDQMEIQGEDARPYFDQESKEPEAEPYLAYLKSKRRGTKPVRKARQYSAGSRSNNSDRASAHVDQPGLFYDLDPPHMDEESLREMSIDEDTGVSDDESGSLASGREQRAVSTSGRGGRNGRPVRYHG